MARQRRLLKQGVKSAGFTRQRPLAGKNQKLSESRAKAFDLALL
jgi:outer membrane protein OmpA-like peptidoglycan-associated protein